jgi:hypothetical protein
MAQGEKRRAARACRIEKECAIGIIETSGKETTWKCNLPGGSQRDARADSFAQSGWFDAGVNAQTPGGEAQTAADRGSCGLRGIAQARGTNRLTGAE